MVELVPEAMALLAGLVRDERRPLTFVSGPVGDLRHRAEPRRGRSRPARPRRDRRGTRRLAPMTERRRTSPARGRPHAHLREAGDPRGVPVVIHHGTPGSSLLYEPHVRDAEEQRDHPALAYDRPGYGGSTRQPGRSVADCAADVAAICDALGIDRFCTWGISGGGPHALATAALLPERVAAAAALASVAPFDAEGLDFTAGMGELNVESFAASRRSRGGAPGAARAGGRKRPRRDAGGSSSRAGGRSSAPRTSRCFPRVSPSSCSRTSAPGSSRAPTAGSTTTSSS